MADFVIFILLLSFVSFAVAFLVYCVCIRFFNNSKAAKLILTPLCVVGWDFLVITRNDISRLILGALPLVLLAAVILYAKWKTSEPAPTPLELAGKSRSVKSLKAREKHKRHAAKVEEEEAWQKRKKNK